MFQEEEELEQEQECNSIATIEDYHKQLEFQIQETTEKRDALKLITKNQLKNINELQEKCEESYIAISQLPENRNAASDRYAEVMTVITKLQGKQFEINELVNLALKEFDGNMQLINNAKDHFSSEINIANQRLLVYETNLKEIKELGERNITNLKESINAKIILLETVKKHSLNNSHTSLQEKLTELIEKKHVLNTKSHELKQETLELEEAIKKENEAMQSLERNTKVIQEQLNKEMESLKMELEISNNYMEDLQQQLDSINANTEFQQNENMLLKNKLYEAQMLSSNLKSSLESKNMEVYTNQNELEKRKIKTSNLKSIISKIAQLKAECSAKATHIQELMEKKNMMVNDCSSLRDRLKEINEKIDIDTTKCIDIRDKTEKINDTINAIKAKTDQQQRELDGLKKASEEKVNSLSEEIEQLTINNSKITVSIKENEEILANQQNTLLSLETELEAKKNVLKEKKEKNFARDEELTKKLEELKSKKEKLLQELQEKKVAINERKKYNESVKTMQEKIAFEKENYKNLIETYEKKKEELKATCNKQLEEKIQELQEIKAEKLKQWEAERDTASKAEFTYYRVKSQAQRLKAEEMLKMLIDWMTNDVSASDTESVLSKNKKNTLGISDMSEVPDCSSKSDSSFDEATESEQAEDVVTQRYHVSRVHGQEALGNEVSYYSISERPIVISSDKPEGSQNVDDQRDKNIPTATQKEKGNETTTDLSSEEAGPSSLNPTLFSHEPAENKPSKHKLWDASVAYDDSSEEVTMKKPKTPQKKILTKRANLKNKKSNQPIKEKTILDMVIDSSN